MTDAPKSKKKSNNNGLLKNKKEWTIPEFQMWLAGFMDMQNSDWVPNAEQWDKIQDIIFKLKDRQLVRKAQPTTPTAPIYPSPVEHFSQPMQQASSTLGNFGGTPADAVNTPFNPNAEFVMTDSGNVPVVSTGARAVKTANIDTSKGYKSAFGDE